jgi:hypothetical protein
MPAEVSKSGGAQYLLMSLDIEKVVLDIETAVFQIKGPGNRRARRGPTTEVSNPYLR